MLVLGLHVSNETVLFNIFLVYLVHPKDHVVPNNVHFIRQHIFVIKIKHVRNVLEMFNANMCRFFMFYGIQETRPMNDAQFFKPIDTSCNFNTRLCDRGKCNKSIRTLIGKTECALTIPDIVEPLGRKNIDREYL